MFCCTDGLRLLPIVSTLRRSLALSAKTAASLSGVDQNVAATAAVSDLSLSAAEEGIPQSRLLFNLVECDCRLY